MFAQFAGQNLGAMESRYTTRGENIVGGEFARSNLRREARRQVASRLRQVLEKL